MSKPRNEVYRVTVTRSAAESSARGIKAILTDALASNGLSGKVELTREKPKPGF